MGTFVNLGNLGIAEEPLDWKVSCVAIPSEDLDRPLRNPHCSISCEKLGHAGLLGVSGSCILVVPLLGPSRLVNHHSGRFGSGSHVCEVVADALMMGNRLAEMQLRLVWEEIVKRFEKIEITGPVVRLKSNFVRGIVEMPVVLHAK